MAGNFALDLSRIVAKANGNIDLVVQKVTLDVFTGAIMKTPVDTGRARGNWQASVGSYAHTSNDATDKAGDSTVAKAAAIALGTPAGNITYIVNSLPYINKLEYGYSKQAPAGMVRITLTEYQQHVNNAAASLK